METSEFCRKKKSFQLDLEVSISMVVILRDKEVGFITPEKMPDFLGRGWAFPLDSNDKETGCLIAKAAGNPIFQSLCCFELGNLLI